MGKLNELIKDLAREQGVAEDRLPDIMKSMDGGLGMKLLNFTVGMFDGDAETSDNPSGMAVKVNVQITPFTAYIFGEELAKEVIFSCRKEQDAYFNALTRAISSAVVASALFAEAESKSPEQKRF